MHTKFWIKVSIILAGLNFIASNTLWASSTDENFNEQKLIKYVNTKGQTILIPANLVPSASLIARANAQKHRLLIYDEETDHYYRPLSDTDISSQNYDKN